MTAVLQNRHDRSLIRSRSEALAVVIVLRLIGSDAQLPADVRLINFYNALELR